MNISWIVKNKIKTFIFINLVFIFFDILENIFYEDFSLPWPSTIILPAIIKNLTGLLGSDFFTSSYSNTPQDFSINIYSFFLNNNHKSILSLFSLSSIFINSFIVTVPLFLVNSIFFSIASSINSEKSKLNFNSTFVNISLIYKSINIFESFFKNYILPESWGKVIYLYQFLVRTPLTGASFGGWTFWDTQSTRGISLGLSLFSIIIPILIDIYKFKLKKTFLYLLLFFLFLLNLLAGLIHPVSPLATLIIMFIYFFINQNINLFSKWKYFFLTSLISYSTAILLVLNRFPQDKIDNYTLFDIYVKIRHPHHYLPSYYLNEQEFLGKIFVNFLIIIFIYIINNLILRNNTLKKILISLLTSALGINLIQFIFVEKLKISIFTKFGISSLSFIFNIFYMICIIYFLYLITLKYNLFFKNKNQSNKFNFLNIGFFQKQFFYPLIFILIILSLITYKLNYSKIEKSSTNKLSIYIASNYDQTSEFIIADNLIKYFKYPRELGGINIFHDNYYPFSTKSIIEWRERGKSLDDLEVCINSNLSSCKLSSNAKVFYISNVFQDKFQLNNKSVYINEIEFFIQQVTRE